MLPSIFVSHGAPTLALDPGQVGDRWRSLAGSMPRPLALLVVSAHWESAQAELSLADTPRTIHDFGGFPAPLYQMRYPAPGAPSLARQAAGRLAAAGIGTRLHADRGLDHGAWVPLQQMYPAADIPVVQLSVQPGLGVAHALAVGEALAPLRNEGVLVLGSGGIVHNLGQLDWQGSQHVMPWAQSFNDWIVERTLAGDRASLLQYRTQAPHATRSHPTEEHLLPFFVAFGAGGQAERIDLGFVYGSLGMDAWLFH